MLLKVLKLLMLIGISLGKYLVTISVLWHANCSASSGQYHFDGIIKLVITVCDGCNKWNQVPAANQSDCRIN